MYTALFIFVEDFLSRVSHSFGPKVRPSVRYAVVSTQKRPNLRHRSFPTARDYYCGCGLILRALVIFCSFQSIVVILVWLTLRVLQLDCITLVCSSKCPIVDYRTTWAFYGNNRASRTSFSAFKGRNSKLTKRSSRLAHPSSTPCSNMKWRRKKSVKLP